jgi:hypothetical protein
MKIQPCSVRKKRIIIIIEQLNDINIIEFNQKLNLVLDYLLKYVETKTIE